MFRHENKYYISFSDRVMLEQTLPNVLKKDPHIISKFYIVTSLYFESFQDKILQEKLDGLELRSKYRIRFYNHDTNYCTLEIKEKNGDGIQKKSDRIFYTEVIDILHNKLDCLQNGNVVRNEFYLAMRQHCLRPKTIVEYKRIPYIESIGNVRITLDYDLKVNHSPLLFGKENIPMYSFKGFNLLEVKYDDVLPSIIHRMVHRLNKKRTACSKYSISRGYM